MASYQQACTDIFIVDPERLLPSSSFDCSPSCWATYIMKCIVVRCMVESKSFYKENLYLVLPLMVNQLALHKEINASSMANNSLAHTTYCSFSLWLISMLLQKAWQPISFLFNILLRIECWVTNKNMQGWVCVSKTILYSTVLLILVVQHADAILRGQPLCRGAQDHQFNGSAGRFLKVAW